MLLKWLEMRAALTRTMTEHRALCNAPTPDVAAISRSRWLISNASRQRAAWFVTTVNPLAERLADRPSGAAWLALQADMPAYRHRISSFVSRWPTEAMVKDWSGYRDDVAELRFAIAQWLRREDVAIRALAVEQEAMAVLPPVTACQA